MILDPTDPNYDPELAIQYRNKMYDEIDAKLDKLAEGTKPVKNAPPDKTSDKTSRYLYLFFLFAAAALLMLIYEPYRRFFHYLYSLGSLWWGVVIGTGLALAEGILLSRTDWEGPGVFYWLGVFLSTVLAAVSSVVDSLPLMAWEAAMTIYWRAHATVRAHWEINRLD